VPLGPDFSARVAVRLTKGLALTAGGVVVGLVAALQVTRLLGYLLYEVSPRDPLAFGSALVVMTVASLVVFFARVARDADGSASRAAGLIDSRHATLSFANRRLCPGTQAACH